MPRKPRRQFSTEQKVAILRRHFVDKVAVSALCEGYELQPSVFYYWQRQALENLARAFQPAPTTSRRASVPDREIEALKAKLAKKNDVIAEISEEYVSRKKKAWGAMNERWVPPDVRGDVIDFVRSWSERTEIPAARFVSWIGVQRGKFYDWAKRYGKANEHNALVPRDHWVEDGERDAILAFQAKNTLEGTGGSRS